MQRAAYSVRRREPAQKQHLHSTAACTSLSTQGLRRSAVKTCWHSSEQAQVQGESQKRGRGAVGDRAALAMAL